MAKEKLILNKEDFEFVQMNEKIFDKKFETKAIGYFGDAFRVACCCREWALGRTGFSNCSTLAR